MPSSDVQARVGKALVDFAVKSQYPDEEAVIAADVESKALPVALELLSNSKASLEDEISRKSREAAPDVDSWIEHAKALQDDIESSKRLASDIIRQAEEDDHRGEVVSEQEAYLSFIGGEVAFSSQLYDTLFVIREASNCLSKAEALINDRQILPCLTALELAWKSIAKIPASRTVRAVRLLDAKCFDLKETAADLLRSIWETLIIVDREGGKITIKKKLDEEPTAMDAAILSLISLEKLQEEAKQFWHSLDEVIIKPRSDLSRRTLRYITFEENTVRLGPETSDSTLKSLFVAMEDLVRYLVEYLPTEFIKPLSDEMMPHLSARLKEFWLDTAVPSTLDDILEYQISLAQVQAFVDNLESLSWPGGDKIEDWIFDAPKIWLNKRRENALDWTRNQLELGIGNPQLAEHVERRTVGKDEGKQIASTGKMVTQEWDAAWDSPDEEPEPLATNRASLEEERRANEVTSTVAPEIIDDDGAADAWGWGDEEAEVEATPEIVGQPAAADTQLHVQSNLETREVRLSETYYSSSIPQPLFKTVATIFNDGARLTSPEFDQFPVTGAAPGLFNLPTLVLAMYRAVSPFHYANHQNGNMFAYNDSIWLCDKLRDFQSEWEKRTDLSSRAFGKVKLDPEIKNLEGFGKRAYSNELISQRTVIRDLLGGAQNFFQEEHNMKGDLEAEINTVVTHIRTIAASWKPILAYSAWASSVGSLVNAVASKLITDVFDLNDVSVDGAERIATIIGKVTKLDDLFVPPSDPKVQNNSTNREQTESVPMTARFANKWMRLQFLSEVLQSNLNDIKFFWFESDLSLYFTAEEVVELIGLSFENNANVRQLKREIKERPRPRVVE